MCYARRTACESSPIRGRPTCLSGPRPWAGRAARRVVIWFGIPKTKRHRQMTVIDIAKLSRLSRNFVCDYRLAAAAPTSAISGSARLGHAKAQQHHPFESLVWLDLDRSGRLHTRVSDTAVKPLPCPCRLSTPSPHSKHPSALSTVHRNLRTLTAPPSPFPPTHLARQVGV